MLEDEDILRLEAHEIVHAASDELLQLVARRQIDLNQIARFELRSRLEYVATMDIIAMQRSMEP